MHQSPLPSAVGLIALLLDVPAAAQQSRLTPDVPCQRIRSAAALDTSTGRVTLFGGGLDSNTSAADDQLWQYQFPVPAAPSLRGFRAFAQAAALQPAGLAFTGGLTLVLGD